MKNSKTWCIGFIITTVFLLMVVISITVFIDPMFHYHKPISFMNYTFDNQRYHNDGISKHFDYDALITGTSMTENFKTSELDELFNVNSIKIPYSGGSFKEVNDAQLRAIKHNPEIKIMIRSLDLYNINRDKDAMREDLGEYPTYLYDENLLNDTKYVLNKDVLLGNDLDTVMQTRNGIPTTNFDDYSNWMASYTFGKETVDRTYERPEKTNEIKLFTEEDKQVITENITQNVTQLADDYPDTQFYYFYPPYSIYYWDSQIRLGTLRKSLDEQRLATELMLQHPNIHVFGFSDDHELICNFDNYKDTTHYGEDINSRILTCMKNGEHELTKTNYQKYYDDLEAFLTNHDYEQYFVEDETVENEEEQ